MNALINHNESDDLNFIYTEFKRVAASIGKAKKSDNMPNSYYKSIAILLSGCTREFVQELVDKMVAEYRAFNMPTPQDVKTAKNELTSINTFHVRKSIYHDEPVISGGELRKNLKKAKVIADMLKNGGYSEEIEQGVKMIEEEKSNVLPHIESVR